MRLATQISTSLGDMENKYESLTTVLSEATVAPDQITQSQAESFCGTNMPHICHGIYVCNQVHPRSRKADIQRDFVAITKMDVSMNSLLVRAKFFSLKLCFNAFMNSYHLTCMHSQYHLPTKLLCRPQGHEAFHRCLGRWE